MENRNSGIDFLRVILMFMVILLHIIGVGGVRDAIPPNTIANKCYHFIYIVCYCAVDTFALISGYTISNKAKKYYKLIEMWFQVFFYSFIVTLICNYLGTSIIINDQPFITNALPVTFDKYWYFTAYFFLFFTMPIINNYMLSINEKTAKIGFILSLALVSVEFYASPFKTNFGYSALGLIMLYCIGAFAKIGKIFSSKKTYMLFLMWLTCILTIWGIRVFRGSYRLINYTSPLIVLASLLLVIIFSRCKIKSKFILSIVPLVFGVYLFHLSPAIWGHIVNKFTFVSNFSFLTGLLYVFKVSLYIFIIGLIIEYFRVQLFKLLKVTSISKSLEKTFSKLLNYFVKIIN